MELLNDPTIASRILPVIVLALVMEGIFYFRRHAAYPWRDSLSSLAIMVGHSLSGVITHAVITAGLALVVWRWRVATIDMQHWWSVLLLFALLEFAYYWYHRSAHRVRLMWGSHSVHHSPEVLTLSAAYRLNWTPLLSGNWLFFLPLVWIGFPPTWVFGMVSANLLYQFWLHTTLIPRLGPIEWVFNTPSSHRVHHASNPEYIDRNYGGVLILFDRLFGTYAAERPSVPMRFGLVHPVASRNPLVLVFNEFRAILRDIRQARNWRERLGFVFAHPGWRPHAPEPITAVRYRGRRTAG
jgi:sterol desaturase/sphingolipid hydroxylase (fatty acid hydroxylase superfamily)